jgi:hypothetical protein
LFFRFLRSLTACRRVCHLVPEEGCELRLVLHPREHAGVQVDAAVGERERIQVRVAHHADTERNRRERLGRLEPPGDIVQICLQIDIRVDDAAALELLLGFFRLAPEAPLVVLETEPGSGGGWQRRGDATRRRQRHCGDQPPHGLASGRSPMIACRSDVALSA